MLVSDVSSIAKEGSLSLGSCRAEEPSVMYLLVLLVDGESRVGVLLDKLDASLSGEALKFPFQRYIGR